MKPNWWKADVDKPADWQPNQNSKLIDSFTGPYRFLSNFEPSIVVFDDRVYPTVEHAYQAAKTLSEEEREKIQILETPGMAKKAGQGLKLREDWENIKVSIMTTLVRRKFHKDPLQSRLIGTGDAELIEGNWWNDTFWGVCKGKGQNNLGKILMATRQELVLWKDK